MQFSLRTTLIGVAILGGLFWTYAQAWGVITGLPEMLAAIASVLYPMVAGAAVGIAVQKKRRGSELLGAIVLGGLGGALGVAFHLLCFDLLNPSGIEYEGLVLVRGSPAMVVGAMVGTVTGVLTLAVWRAIMFLRMIDAEHL